MQLKRFFTTAHVKNSYKYLDTQKKYELLRTALYFGISIALLIAGYAATKSKTNLLTVVAVLGCLPASKSLVSCVMFFKHHSTGEAVYNAVSKWDEAVCGLYDLVFTSEKRTFTAFHGGYHSKCLVLLAGTHTKPQELENHMNEYLHKAGLSNVNVKAYTDLDKYAERLAQMVSLEPDRLSGDVIQLLKEITL